MKHYIYIPGFNDQFDFLRRLALSRWRSRETVATLVTMKWSDKAETYEQKYQRITDAIARIKDDQEIILVGESAGGTMALSAFALNLERVSSVVTICGYNQGSGGIHALHREQKPAFYEASQRGEKSIENLSTEARRRILTIYSTADTVVTPLHSQIDGAREIVLHTKGHLLSIWWVLLKGLDKVAKD